MNIILKENQGIAQRTAVVSILFFAIIVVAVIAIHGAFGSNSGDTQNAMIGLLCLWSLVLICLVVIGSKLGIRQKIAVYDSRRDLYITGGILIFWLISIIAFFIWREHPPSETWGPGLCLLPVIVATIHSIRRTCRCNPTIWGGILSVVTKYILVVVAAILGILTIQMAFGVFDNTKKKKYEDAAANLFATIIGAVGAWKIRKLINSLIVEGANHADPKNADC